MTSETRTSIRAPTPGFSSGQETPPKTENVAENRLDPASTPPRGGSLRAALREVAAKDGSAPGYIAPSPIPLLQMSGLTDLYDARCRRAGEIRRSESLVSCGRGDGLCSRCLGPVLFGGCGGKIVSHKDNAGRIIDEHPRRGGG